MVGNEHGRPEAVIEHEGAVNVLLMVAIEPVGVRELKGVSEAFGLDESEAMNDVRYY